MKKTILNESEKKGSPDRFGHSWNIFNEILPIHEEQFLRWTTGFDKSFWKDKSILDVGCGIGRNSYWPLSYGAKSCLSIDIDDRTLEAARTNLQQFETAHIDKRSAYDISESNKFDIVFSIGVIHHLDNPDLAIKEMTKALKPGGKLLVWLYGHENNEILIRYFNPLRKLLFSKMPLKLVYALSFIATASLWSLLKLGIGKTEYMQLIRSFSFRHLRAIIYDHMIPEIAQYYTKEQAIHLLERANLQNIEINWVNEMSWSVIGEKCSTPINERSI